MLMRLLPVLRVLVLVVIDVVVAMCVSTGLWLLTAPFYIAQSDPPQCATYFGGASKCTWADTYDLGRDVVFAVVLLGLLTWQHRRSPWLIRPRPPLPRPGSGLAGLAAPVAPLAFSVVAFVTAHDELTHDRPWTSLASTLVAVTLLWLAALHLLRPVTSGPAADWSASSDPR